MFAAGIAIVAVGLGSLFRLHDNWLIYRHQAELCRLLRYRFLILPSVWRDSDDPAQWIEERLDEIKRMQGTTGLEKAVKEPSAHGPFEGTQHRLRPPELRALTEYYLAKRLSPQKEYLANRAQRNEIKDWMRALLPWCFFASIAAVFAKVIMTHYSSWYWFGIWAAATLPVLAAGICTWLSAFEFP